MNNKQDVRSLDVSIDEWMQMIRSGAGCTAKVIPHGNSMWPLIRSDKDMVEITSAEQELKPGDIVVFRRSDGQAVIHRIFRISGDELQTFGDNCDRPDAPIKRSDVIGIAARIHRGSISFDPNKTAGLADKIRSFTKEIRKIRKKLKSRMISE